MAEINLAPKIVCDNCGTQTDKQPVGYGADRKWKKPLEWGHVRVAPTYWRTYPNNIDLLDLCPACNKAVHDAVSASLEACKLKEKKDG